jgi:hypothetical protein
VEELEQTLHRIITMGAKERDSARARSKELSMLADWSYMYDNYLKAYNKANMALGSQ